MNRTDTFSPEKRREIMQAVLKADTAPERRLRLALWHSGLRYRKQRRILGTKPDLSFVGRRVAVFVDGCFWHGCPKHYKPPISNREYWLTKVERNQARDRRNDRELIEAGWTVLRFWECEIKSELPEVVARVRAAVLSKGEAE